MGVIGKELGEGRGYLEGLQNFLILVLWIWVVGWIIEFLREFFSQSHSK
jgi:hypothetical protein